MVLLAACSPGLDGPASQQRDDTGGCHACGCPGSPIIIDTAGDGIHLTGWEDGVVFPLAGPGQIWQWAWTLTGTDDGFLARDANLDGELDGSELFGDASPQDDDGNPPNGFAALKRLDDNSDLVIDATDSAWVDLFLWVDVNHDAKLQAWERRSLDDVRISAISLSYGPVSILDKHGNELRWASQLTATGAVGRTAYDAWLVARPADASQGRASIQSVSWTCDAWSYAVRNIDSDDDGDEDDWIACDSRSAPGYPLNDIFGYRLVSAAAISDSYETAKQLAINDVNRVMNDFSDFPERKCSGMFNFTAGPAGDRYASPPYDEPGDENNPRVKCVSRTLGGGGTGGPVCD